MKTFVTHDPLDSDGPPPTGPTLGAYGPAMLHMPVPANGPAGTEKWNRFFQRHTQRSDSPAFAFARVVAASAAARHARRLSGGGGVAPNPVLARLCRQRGVG